MQFIHQNEDKIERSEQLQIKNLVWNCEMIRFAFDSFLGSKNRQLISVKHSPHVCRVVIMYLQMVQRHRVAID